MGFQRGDRVIAVRDLGGGIFDSEYVPKGTIGTVIDVDGGFLSSDLYTVKFTIERMVFDDSHPTINRLSADDLGRA
jgi:hypothetical protein